MKSTQRGPDARRIADRVLAGRAPPWALVDARLRLLDTGGRSNPHVAVPRGSARPPLVEMVAVELAPALTEALTEALREGGAVRREASESRVSLEVIPIRGAGSPRLLVLFGESPRPASAVAGDDELGRALEGLDFPILLVRGDRRLRFTARAAALLRLSADDAGRALGEARRAAAGLEPLIADVLDGLGPREGELDGADGRRYRVEVRPRWTADGALDGAVAWFTDVDAERQALDDVHAAHGRAIAARAIAEQANRAKDVFLATLSHELRVPLHTITLQSDLLTTGAAPGPAKARRIGQAIGAAARGQERIISDLLDVSAIMAGKMRIKRQPVDMAGVVGAAVRDIRAAAAARQLRLRVAMDRSAELVLGDPTRLHQIVANLLSNAVKFTPAGGQVAVALSRATGGVRVVVKDTGQGIAPDLLPHVFDRFVQAGTSETGYGGLGLGLAIVRDLVRLHRGAVRAESHGIGRGAVFTVDLPALTAVRAAKDAEPPPLARQRAELKGIRVLVVEHDAGSRDVLSDILRFRAAEVRAVGSAAEVVTALAEFRPDVLLCDVMMPGEDGYSLMRRVRSLDADKGGRVLAVALTALASKQDRRRARTAGFHMHVSKPTEAAALCRAVRRVYRRARTTE
jgi:signal transduction histidine kinase/CheY-like chemotaxis protein